MPLNPIKNNVQLPPPKDWQDFERLTHDLWSRIWKDDTASLNGRGGQAQNGVDVFGRKNGTGSDYIGVQCKGKDAHFGEPVSEDELRGEVKKALGFTPKITSFILVTTYQDDAGIQAVARTITTEHQQKGLFDVTVLGWGNITQKITDHIDVLIKHWPQYQYLRLPVPEFKTRLESYYTHYLGSQQEPVGFGGRDEVLKELDEWLNGPTHTPYRLLLAEAGRGKTSLLTRWSVQESLKTGGYQVIFIPVSIRFNFNSERDIFSYLLVSLSRFFDMDIRPFLNSEVSLLRELCAGYLRGIKEKGIKVLLIIDGLDEAKGWTIKSDLLPPTNMDGLKVLISHRRYPDDCDGNRLLEQFNWAKGTGDMLRLNLLSKQGVGEVIKSRAFCPAEDEDYAIETLHHLSDGDPLVLCLYLDELAKDPPKVRSTLSGFNTIAPGLDGYFTHWWAEQRTLWANEELRQRSLQALLNLLSMAKGPLTRTDLLTLLGDLGFSSYDLENDLLSISRFIVGEGGDQGYIFAHPRFGYYLREKLAKVELERFEKVFLEWGAKVLAACLSGDTRVPVYLLHNYALHLATGTDGLIELCKLLDQYWISAHVRSSGNYTGFIQDVELIEQTIRPEDQSAIKAGQVLPHLPVQVECLLCHGGIHTLSQRIIPAVLEKLFDEGFMTLDQALSFCKHYWGSYAKIDALTRILANPKSLPAKDRILEELFQLLLASDQPSFQSEQLQKLVQAAVTIPSRQITTYLGLLKDEQRIITTSAFFGLLDKPVRELYLEELLNKAKWEEGFAVPFICENISPYITQKAALQLADKFRKINNYVTVRRALTALLPAFDENEADRLVSEIESSFQTDAPQEYELMGFLAAATAFVSPSQKNNLFARIDHFLDTYLVSNSAIDLLIKLVKQGAPKRENYLTNIHSDIAASTDPLYRAYWALALFELLPAIDPHRPLPDTLYKTIQELPRGDDKASFLIRYSNFVDKDERHRILTDIPKQVSPMDDPHLRLKGFHHLLPYLSGERHERAIALIQNCLTELQALYVRSKNNSRGPSYWTELAEGLSTNCKIFPATFHPEMIRICQSIEDHTGRAYAFSGILAALAGANRTYAIEQALRALQEPMPTHAAAPQHLYKALVNLTAAGDAGLLKQIEGMIARVSDEQKPMVTIAFEQKKGDLTFPKSFEAISAIPYDNLKIRCLVCLKETMPANLDRQFLDYLETIPLYQVFQPGQTDLILMKAALYRKFGYPDQKIVELLDQLYLVHPDKTEQIRCLTGLYPYLGDDLLQKWFDLCFQAINRTDDMMQRYRVVRLLYLSNHFPIPSVDKDQLLTQLFYRVYPDHHQREGEQLARHLEFEITDLIEETPEAEQNQLPGLLTGVCLNLNIPVRYVIYTKCMEILKKGRHFDILMNLDAILPLWVSLSKDGDVPAVFDHVVETCTWWKTL